MYAKPEPLSSSTKYETRGAETLVSCLRGPRNATGDDRWVCRQQVIETRFFLARVRWGIRRRLIAVVS